MSQPADPTEAELIGYFDELSNWGRWGDHDELGTLNLITDEHRRRAAGLIHTGRSVSCAWDIDTSTQPDDGGGTPRRLMVTTGQGLADPARGRALGREALPRGASASEYWFLHPHGYRLTHLDGLSHIFWDGRMYNNRPAELVTSALGATELDLTPTRDGIITRAILVDAAAHRGVDWIEPGDGVRRAEVEEILRGHDLTVGPGDALLLRTGYGAKVRRQGRDHVIRDGRSGWHADCLPWLRANDIALVAADTAQDIGPSGYPAFSHPIHTIGIVAMGLWLVDNCDLEAIARTCRELNRWEFALTVAPIAFVGATCSPVNPLAVF